jgi:hypothetical protein
LRPSRRQKEKKSKKALNRNEDGSNNAVPLAMTSKFLHMNEAHHARAFRPSRPGVDEEEESEDDDSDDSCMFPGAFRIGGSDDNDDEIFQT